MFEFLFVLFLVVATIYIANRVRRAIETFIEKLYFNYKINEFLALRREARKVVYDTNRPDYDQPRRVIRIPNY